MAASMDKLRDEIMQLDREFDQATHERGLDAWVSYFAEDGVMVPPKGEVMRRPEIIRAAMAQTFALPGFSLRWSPEDARVSEDGTMAYTYGQYERKYQNKAGEWVTASGRYTTIWGKQADGTWKITLDMGN